MFNSVVTCLKEAGGRALVRCFAASTVVCSLQVLEAAETRL